MGKEEIFENLYKLSLAKSQTEKQIENEIRELKILTIPMGEKTFWKELKKLNKHIEEFAYYTDRDKYKCGVNEYIRQAAVNNQLMIVMSFVVTYEAKMGAIYDPLYKLIEGSDDTLSDILDSFPLFGEERYNMALEGNIDGDSNNQYQGENYIGMRLTEGLQRFARNFKEGNND